MISSSKITQFSQGVLIKALRMQTEKTFIVSFVLMVLSAAIIRLIQNAGGSPSIFDHLIYIPLILIGLLFGFRIGFLFGLLIALILGPFSLTSPFVSDNLVTGGWFILLLSCTTVPVIAGLASGTLKASIRQNRQSALRNTDTGLPNLRALLHYLKRLAKNKHLADNELFDIIDIRFKNFEDIQQKIGAEKAHKLLKLVAKQLKDLLGDQVQLGQTGQSEFIGVKPAGKAQDSSSHQALQDYLKKDIQTDDGASYQLEPSASILRVSKDQIAQSSEDVIDKSRQQAYEVKDNDDILSFFDESSEVPEQSSFSKQFHDALATEEISLRYQPRLSTVTGHFEALEVSTRWLHPGRGDIPLSDFQSMIKENDLTKEYLLWVVEQCFKDLAEFKRAEHYPRVSLDVSTADQVEPNVLYALANSIRSTEYPPTSICIEISDAALMNLSTKDRAYLEKLHNIGCNIIAAHFGEHFSTIQSLFKLPVDAIKLSPELIQSASSNSDAKRQLASIVKIAHSKGLRTIATGVDSREQLILVKQVGCEELQGAFLTSPLRKSELPWDRIK